MFRFYILHSVALDKFYVGHTGDDINNRINKHLTDHSGFTGRAKDWKLAYTETFATKEEAYARERQVKGWKSRRSIIELISRHSSAGSAHPGL